MTENNSTITKDDLYTIRFWIKRELECKYLPTLPDIVEEQLFLEGRSAWNFKYTDLVVEPKDKYKLVRFKMNAQLKKEFKILVKKSILLQYRILCTYQHKTGKHEILEINPIEVQLTNGSTQTSESVV